MIAWDQVIPLLLQACPGFQSSWQSHLDRWDGYEPDEEDLDDIQDGNVRSYYNDVAAFAWYLVDQVRTEETECFPAAFGVVERLIQEGNDHTRDLVVIGLLEDLQTISLNVLPDPDTFVQWLGPASLQGWREVEEMWRGKGSLMDVLRAEMRGSEPSS